MVHPGDDKKLAWRIHSALTYGDDDGHRYLPYVAERIQFAALFGIDPRIVDDWSDLELHTNRIALAELRKHNLLPKG